jgi:hypothetical protein
MPVRVLALLQEIVDHLMLHDRPYEVVLGKEDDIDLGTGRLIAPDEKEHEAH